MITTSQLTGVRKAETDRWIYFGPPQYDALPPEHQDQILFLDEASTETVYKIANSVDPLCGDDGWGNQPFSGDCYESVEDFLYRGHDIELKKWLYNRGIPFKQEVLLLPTFKAVNSPAILATWKMVIKYVDPFFTSDNLVVINPDITWCLHFHHDGMLYFANNRKKWPNSD